ncbi:MAG: rod shape-determining protein [Christensenellales bacterium]
MLRKKAIIDFDSERVAVMSDGVLVKLCPSAVIRKASETPVVISYGEAAEAKKHSLGEYEIYCTPFRCGKIADEAAARIIFRSVLREVFGNNPFVSVYVLISGGLSAEDKQTIEKTICACGYNKVYLIPRPKVIARLLGFNDLFCGLYMDSDLSELVIAKEGKTVCSHTIDVSVSALAELLRDRFLSDSKLKLPLETSVEIAGKYCSLFESDSTKIVASGKDAITSSPKSVYFTARDVYPVTDSVYSKVTALINAALLDLDTDFAIATVKSGILFMGSGVRICGFEEYVYRKLGLSGFIDGDASTLLAAVDSIAENEPDWIEENAE